VKPISRLVSATPWPPVLPTGASGGASKACSAVQQQQLPIAHAKGLSELTDLLELKLELQR
jgi:hypothetical protein